MVSDTFCVATCTKVACTCRLKIGGAKAVITQDAIMRAGKLHPLYDKVAAATEATAIVIPHSGQGMQARAGLEIDVHGRLVGGTAEAQLSCMAALRSLALIPA